MPKFYFHIDGEHDSEGTDLESLPVAKCQAVKMAGQLICDQADDFWDNAEWTMTVTDEAGLSLFLLNVVGIDAPALPSGRQSPEAQAVITTR